MAYPIEHKLVIAVSTSALFDMQESDQIFRTQGVEAYRKFQEEHIDIPLGKGVAFPFIKRFLRLNEAFPQDLPVEVVVFSKNSPETGLRAFRSIQHYGLNITRACFSSLRARAISNTCRLSTLRCFCQPIRTTPVMPSMPGLPQER